MTAHIRKAALLAAATTLLGTLAGCGSTDHRPHPQDQRHKERGSQDAAAQSAPSRAAGQKPFTLVATGDILSHDSVIRQARADAGGSGYDFREMLSGAKPLASRADLAICHMETVYGASGGPFTGYPAFKTPPDVAGAIKDTGYDSCSSASNHTMDDGFEGVRRTIRGMDEAGLKHAGSARSRKQQSRPTLMRAGGATVAQLAYTYGTNGLPVPKKQSWAVNLIDPARIIADARAARRAGADVVVASLHWGTEWQEAPDHQQKTLAKQLTSSRHKGRKDIDLIIGTHAHVPQAYEKVNGTWVVYGMGDQLAGKMNDPRGAMSSAARFTFVPPRGGESRRTEETLEGKVPLEAKPGGGRRAAEDGRPARDREWTVKKAEFVPFFVQTSPRISVVDLSSPAARAGGAGRAEAYSKIRKAVLSRGAAKQGLRMGD
ncbi:CapA family protein [Streptomyces ovatisporus]|uniref:CapA family protein n=1 Tax=Streptomyces ovatisporus TaxID=1128682 RepID=A0ABV9A6Q1_9ACTN